MSVVRVSRLLAVGALVAAAGLVFVRFAGGSPAPAPTVGWANPPVATSSARPSMGTSLMPIASPQATSAAPGDGALGFLHGPLTALWHQLNADTKDSAQGEYSILQSLERGIRDRIEDFLRWVTGHHQGR